MCKLQKDLTQWYKPNMTTKSKCCIVKLTNKQVGHKTPQ